MIDIDTHELAWAAGFFDGEGSTMWAGVKRKELTLSVAQVDYAPLARFHKAIGHLGVLRGPYKHKNPKHKPYWVVASSSYVDTQAIIALLWRWLSEPKREQASRCLLAAIPHYRTRYLRGRGRARLTRVQARELRAEHAAARAGRERVPQGWIARAAERYDVKPDTIAAICQGRGYNDQANLEP